MTKTIETLVTDMEEVILGNGGWDKTITKYLAENISQIAEDRFSKPQEPRGYLSLSGLGTPCKRKLWYRINETDKGEPLTAESLGTFFYGDMIEALAISLAKAAGHEVTGEQDQLDVHGIKGHRDCVIDGVTVDVKSASKYGFQKFQSGSLREDDPFGYISQLSSYVYAGKDDPLVRDKTRGAFLVIQKDRFKLCLDQYDFTEELKHKEQEIESTQAIVSSRVPPARLDPVPQSKTSPNKALGVECSYCVVPDTLILTDDFTWKKASSLDVGSGILGFDEEPKSNHRRYYRYGSVSGIKSINLPTVTVKTDMGSITVSADHKFLCKNSSGNLPEFREASALKSGYQIYMFDKPWEDTPTLEKQYLSGFFDGEGCFSNGYLTWAQVPGAVSTKVLDYMGKLGYLNNQRYTNSEGACETFRLYGGKVKSIRALGEIRPVRLLEKLKDSFTTLSVTSPSTQFGIVQEVIEEGVQEVIAIETTTKTYISNGFLSHNCEFRKHCWPEVRTFLYSSGPTFLVEVNKQPNVTEVVG